MLAVVNIKWAVLHKVNHHCYLRFIKRKVNANREQNLSSLLEQLCRDAALLTQKYKDFLKRQNVSTFFYQFNQKNPAGLAALRDERYVKEMYLETTDYQLFAVYTVEKWIGICLKGCGVL